MMKKYSYIVLSVLLGACTTPSVNETPFPAFNKVEKLQADTIPYSEIIAPDFLMAKGQSLFIASSRSDSMLWQYALPELTLTNSGARKGQQADEFSLFPMFVRTPSDKLYIWGYTPFTIKEFAVDTLGVRFEKKFTLPTYENFNQMHIVRDSLLLYSAIPSEFAIKGLNLNNKEKWGKIEFKRDDHQETFFYSNRGIMAANDDFVVYAYSFKKQIDIYRVDDMKLHKRIVNQTVKPEIRVGDLEHTVQHYANVIASSRYIYALLNEKGNRYRMEVLDLDGQPVSTYEFDIAPFLFDVDEENGYLYGYNENYENYLLRYKLPKTE